jgi:hypothetical protein
MLKLTKDEIAFLRWLRTNGGKACLSGKIKAHFANRVIFAGYVASGTDAYRPDTVHYTLTEHGREALGVHEK